MKTILLPLGRPLQASILSILVLAAAVVDGTTNVRAQSSAPPRTAIDDYEPGPDSQPQPGVPKGKTSSFPLEASKIFPVTVRNIAVYVPAQYTGDKLYVTSSGRLYQRRMKAAGAPPFAASIKLPPWGAGSAPASKAPEIRERIERFFDKQLRGQNVSVSGETIQVVQAKQPQ